MIDDLNLTVPVGPSRTREQAAQSPLLEGRGSAVPELPASRIHMQSAISVSFTVRKHTLLCRRIHCRQSL